MLELRQQQGAVLEFRANTDDAGWGALWLSMTWDGAATPQVCPLPYHWCIYGRTTGISMAALQVHPLLPLATGQKNGHDVPGL